MRSSQGITLALSVSLASCLPSQEQADEVRFVDAFPGQAKFDRPIYVDSTPADPEHLWIVQQTGKLLRIPRDGESGERQVVLDLSSTCFHPSNGGHNEEGFLGFAFALGYSSNHHIFTYWSRKTGGSGRSTTRESVIARYTTVKDGDSITADPESKLEILQIEQPWGNHNGGTIVFGPDGMLYVALGDGGAANDPHGNGQDLATLLASILRIDVRGASEAEPYTVPADNPFVLTEGARGEIWAYGLRNPWRIAFDRVTGELWCGDVGQNLHEEVDRIEKGGNYGWSLMEATHPFPPGEERSGELVAGMIAPVAEYPRSAGISVTGGHVYRGKRLPELVGRYVYGDFAMRTVWAVREVRDGGANDVLELGRAPAPLASFGELPGGELVALCFDGHIYALAPADSDGK